MITNAQARTLATTREKVADELQSAALRDDTPTAQLKDLGERLRHLDMALQEHRAAAARRLLLLAVLAVAAIVTLLACVPVFLIGIDVEADIEATQVRLSFAREETLPSAALLAPVSVEGASRVDLRGTDRTAGKAALDTVRIASAKARLESLTVASGGALEIGTDASGLAIALSPGTAGAGAAKLFGDTGGAGSGKVELRWLPAFDGTVGPPLLETFEGTEIVHVTPHGSAGRSLRIFAPGGTLAWAPRGVGQIEFLRPAAGDRFESSVVMARLKVGPKGSKTTLAEGDDLELSGMKISELRVGVCSPGQAPDQMSPNASCRRVSLHLVGKASDIRVRQAHREFRSLVPSWLSYLKESHLVSLLWASALFVWGTGWSLWKAWVR